MNLGRMLRLIHKELAEILRDRRTIVTLLLMPVLLYPLLGLAFSQVFAAGTEALQAPRFRLAFVDPAQEEVMTDWLIRGQVRLLRAGQLVDRTGDKQARLQPLGAQQDLIAQLEVLPTGTNDEAEAALRGGEVDLLLRRTGKVFTPDKDGKLETDWEMLYREDSVTGREAYRYVRRLIEAADLEYLHRTWQAAGVRQRIDPTHIIPVPVAPDRVRQTSFLSALIPLVLILMTITGAVYPAIDLTAGERERGTMEILAAAPIPRWRLLLAKYVAVLTVALLTALVNIAPMIAVLALTGLAQQAFGMASLPRLIGTLAIIFALLVLFAAFFSAVLLTITSFARSFKEAQAYLVPVMLLALAPGILALLPGIELTGAMPYVPLLNIVLLARDLLEGTVNWATGALVIGVTVAYAVLALLFAARIFGADEMK